MAVQRFVGLMSGTSLDGVDAALVRFDGTDIVVESSRATPFPSGLKRGLASLCADPAIDPVTLATVEAELTDTYADTVTTLLSEAGLAVNAITAIGCHGQTIRHLPEHAFSWQIGNPARLAATLALPVVADFRRADLAIGGQGAPLAPAFHQAFFAHPDEHRMAVNIGGIANVTDLPADGAVTGWDTGPGNTLLDHWYRQHHGHGHWDEKGRWADSGHSIPALVEGMMADPYFSRRPPKSTGPEYFSPDWLDRQLRDFRNARPKDIQASLAELTCRPIVATASERGATDLIVCGGGAFNDSLMCRLDEHLPDVRVRSSSNAGIPADHVESAGFAWLARQHWLGRPGNLPAVTGARAATRLGAIWWPPEQDSHES